MAVISSDINLASQTINFASIGGVAIDYPAAADSDGKITKVSIN